MKVCIICAIYRFGLSPEDPSMDQFYLSTCQHCGRNRFVIQLLRNAEQPPPAPCADEVLTDMPNWERIATDNMQICSGELIIVDTSTIPMTLLAPLTPSIDDMFSIYDYGGNLSNNPVAIDRNGENIMGLAENMVLNNNNRQYHFEYRGTMKGWRIVVI